MKRFLPPLLIIAGFSLLVGGFIYDVIFAGIPYQDPTPEMSARYRHHANIASVIRWFGVGAFLFGALAGISRWVVRRYRSKVA
jgi:hypothetical protein